MSARTLIFVRVIKTHDEWIPVYAVTIDEAKFDASKLPNVAAVLDAKYEVEFSQA